MIESDQDIKEYQQKIREEIKKYQEEIEYIKNKIKSTKKIVYVLYWVDLDDDCLKKSIIRIVGVYSNKVQAEFEMCMRSHRKGYSDDSRLYYYDIFECKIDKSMDLTDNGEDFNNNFYDE
jgi:hypothetical protein